jgi:hypothetical protein
MLILDFFGSFSYLFFSLDLYLLVGHLSCSSIR